MQKILKQTLEYAYEYEITQKNLWELIKISTINCTDSRYANHGEEEYDEYEDEDDIGDQKCPQFFNNAERAAVVAQCWADYRKDPTNIVPLMILLDFNSGVRNGELTALKPKDIEDGKLFVRRMEITYQGPDGKNIRKIVNRTKSRKGRRKIRLKPAAIEILSLVPKDEEYLFMKKGKRVATCITDKYIRKVCNKVGIEERSIHKIRKTFISKLFETGMHPKKIKEVSGHDNMDTLYKSYCFNT
jgi:integrase